MMNLQSNKCDTSIKSRLNITELPKIFLLQSQNQRGYLLQVRFGAIWLLAFHSIYTVFNLYEWLKLKMSVQ